MLKKLKPNKRVRIVGIGLCCLFFLGCSKESLILEQADAEVISNSTETVDMEEAREEIEEEENSIKQDKKENAKEMAEIAVHICGAVNQPGVYVFKGKARIQDGIQKAGGFREDASKDYLNLALLLEDGMKIEVPTREMVTKWEEESSREAGGISYGNEKESASKEQTEHGKVNLNTADLELLCTLPGIGESRAKSIIAYREKQGGFQSIEDVMEVSGIKEAAFEKIKEYITVSR